MPASNGSMTIPTMLQPRDIQRPLTGELLLLLAGLAALGSLATNIILPAFPAMGADLGTSVKDLSATLGTFFVAFAVGQLVVGPLSDRGSVAGGWCCAASSRSWRAVWFVRYR
jgi:MFS family permease